MCSYIFQQNDSFASHRYVQSTYTIFKAVQQTCYLQELGYAVPATHCTLIIMSYPRYYMQIQSFVTFCQIFWGFYTPYHTSIPCPHQQSGTQESVPRMARTWASHNTTAQSQIIESIPRFKTGSGCCVGHGQGKLSSHTYELWYSRSPCSNFTPVGLCSKRCELTHMSQQTWW